MPEIGELISQSARRRKRLLIRRYEIHVVGERDSLSEFSGEMSGICGDSARLVFSLQSVREAPSHVVGMSGNIESFHLINFADDGSIFGWFQSTLFEVATKHSLAILSIRRLRPQKMIKHELIEHASVWT